MSVSSDLYEKARKKGLNCYRARSVEGKNPYLPVLDDLISGEQILRQKRHPVQEIMLDQVVGTKTAARTNAFASNFMPLLENHTEFADKWLRLYEAQTKEGIRDAVKVYEVAGRYFVEEGNKRVSVLKYAGSPSILAEVHELFLEPEDSKAGRLDAEFHHFAEVTGVHAILMSKPKNYGRLLKLINPDSLESFTPAMSSDLLSSFKTFYTVLMKMGGRDLKVTPGDAYLIYLSEYGWNPDAVMVQSVVHNELEKIWDHLLLDDRKHKIHLTSSTETSDKTSLISSFLPREPLKVAFIDVKDPASSSWTAEHAKAREALKKEMGEEIQIKVYEHADNSQKTVQALEKAIADGSQVIFLTNPAMLKTANKYAAKYPKIKFLNCSLNLDTGILRTYYAREFETQFLMGVLAGILSETKKIGYIASYPILGSVANINAFAIGVQMTKPDAGIYLDWSTTTSSLSDDYPLDIDILYIEGERFSTDFVENRKYGLFDVSNNRFCPLASQTIRWDVFYRKILKSILNNTWKSDAFSLSSESINYWWGLSNGMLELHFSRDLPEPTRRLAQLLKDSLSDGSFSPFAGRLTSQEGVAYDQAAPMPLEDIALMDWLNSNIRGRLPKESQISQNANPIVLQYGVEKVLEDDQQ